MTREEAIDTVRNIYQTDKEKEALETLIPELCESEDERMCTRCIDLLRKVSAYSGEEYLGVEIADCIIGLQALIKKHKESLHIQETCKENADSFTDEDERIRKNIIGYIQERIDEFPDDVRLVKRWKKEIAWLESLPERFTLSIKQEWDGFDEDCLKRAIWYVENPAPSVIKDSRLALWLNTLRSRFFLKPQPKETWNEEDERMLKSTIWHISNSVTNGKNTDCKCDLTEWLEDRLKHFRPQPKQEWNEKDEKTLWGLTAYIPNEELERLGVTRDDILKKLKSLRSYLIQLKEAYKDGFQTARHATALAFINCLDENRPEGKVCLSNGECEEIEKAFLVGDWEKIERYFNKYRWKPSEEQMEHLQRAVNYYESDWGENKLLRILINDLKKRM